jgi:hypothetical protein
LCAVYFVWELYGRRWGGRFVPMGLFTLLALLCALNVSHALQTGLERRAFAQSVERDLRSGTTPLLLAFRHKAFFGTHVQGEALADCLRRWREAGIGPYRRLQPDPPLRRLHFRRPPVEMHGMTPNNGTWVASGTDPYLVFALNRPQPVYGILLRCAYEGSPATIDFQAYWKAAGHAEFTEEKSIRVPEAGGGDKTYFIPVNATIEQFRIDPDNKPCLFQYSDITLLVPAADADGEDSE